MSEIIQLTEQTTECPVSFTEAAIKEFLLQSIGLEGGPSPIRIGCKGGGCSGFLYILDFINESDIDPEDDVIYNINTLQFVIDVFSADYLKQTTIDYVSTLKESGFKFINNRPGSRQCGCGSSFSG